MAAKRNITIDQGATFILALTWSRNDILADLTGYTARMQMRENFDDVTPQFSVTTEDGGIVLGGVAGTIDIEVSATKTAAINCEVGKYDIELIDPFGYVTRLLQGNVNVSLEATK